MRIRELSRRFRETCCLARSEIQRDLELFLRDNPFITNRLLCAVGIGGDETGSLLRPSEKFWTEDGDRHWFLSGPGSSVVPGRREEEANKPRIFSPRNGPMFGGEGPTWRVASSLFGAWFFFYDRSRGSYYFPFPEENLVFFNNSTQGEGAAPGPVIPEAYTNLVGSLLEGYSLTIGQGSAGFAQLLGRDVIVEDTLTDPRGSVALEDLMLRNFAYQGFRLTSRSGTGESRFSGPFAHLGLMFPGPVGAFPAGDSDWKEVFTHLARPGGCRDVVSQLLEPLVCHFEDFQLLGALRRVGDRMAAVEGDTEDLRRAFADAVCNPFGGPVPTKGGTLKPEEDQPSQGLQGGGATPAHNLRDPFAFGTLHILEQVGPGSTLDAGPSQTVKYDLRSYWHGEGSFGSTLRTRLLEVEYDKPGEGQPVDRVDAHTAVLENSFSALGLTDHEVKWPGTPARTGREGIFCPEEDSPSSGASQYRLGLVGKGFEAASVKVLERRFDAVIGSIGKAGFGINNLFETWAGHPPLQMETERESDSWEQFGSRVRHAKAIEILDGLVLGAFARRVVPGMKMAEKVTDNSERPSNIGRKLSALLERVAPFPAPGERLEPILSAFNSAMDSVAPVQEIKSSILCFVMKKARTGLSRFRVYPVTEDWRSRVESELRVPFTQQPLRFAAQFAADLPGKGDWRLVEVAPESEGGNNEPIDSAQGFHENGPPFNYGLMTALSTGLLAGSGDEAPLRFLYARRLEEEGRSLLVLTDRPDLDDENLQSLFEGDDAQVGNSGAVSKPAANFPESLSHRAIIMEWVDTQGRWDVPAWSIDGRRLQELLRPGRIGPKSKLTRKEEGIELPGEHVRGFIKHCLYVKDDCRTKGDTATGHCFPQAVFRRTQASLHPNCWVVFPAGNFEDRCEDCFKKSSGCSQQFQWATTLLSSMCQREEQPIFSPDWGWRRQVIWPLLPRTEGGAPGLRGFVFFGFQLPRHLAEIATSPDPAQAPSMPLSLTGLHLEMINESLDYLEFVMREHESRRDLGTHLGQFSHSLRDLTGPMLKEKSFGELAKGLLPLLAAEGSRRNLEIPPEIERWGESRVPTRDFDLAGALLFSLTDDPDGRKKLKHLWVELVAASNQSEEVSKAHWVTRSLLDALTRTMAGKPEFPAGLQKYNANVTESPFKSLEDWWSWVVVRRAENLGPEKFPPAWRDAFLEGTKSAGLQDISCFPGSSLQLVLEEFMRNCISYADNEHNIEFKCSLCDGILSVSLGNVVGARNGSVHRNHRATGQGIATIRRVLFANLGESGSFTHDPPKGPGEHWEATMNFSLFSYRERAFSYNPGLEQRWRSEGGRR